MQNRIHITLEMLVRDDPTAFTVRPGDDQIVVAVDLASWKEALLAISAAHSNIQELAREHAAAEQRISRLEQELRISELSHSPTWDEVFAGAPIAPGSEAAQQRHKELRAKPGELTEAEEQELNQLFYTMYPQFDPKNR